MGTRVPKTGSQLRKAAVGPVAFLCAFAVFCLGFGGLFAEADALQSQRAQKAAQQSRPHRVATQIEQPAQVELVKTYPVLYPPLLEKTEAAAKSERKEEPAEEHTEEFQKEAPAPAEQPTADTVVAQAAPVAPEQPQKRTKTVHHSAYARKDHYKTVRHPASVARKVQVDGVDSIEWSQCPICGEHHEKVYEERVLDYYDESLCAACGGKHDRAYDEVVEY